MIHREPPVAMVAPATDEAPVNILSGGPNHYRRSDGERAVATLIRWAALPEPVREYQFAPPRRWRLDFAWPDRMLALEIEGGTWSGGRHVRGAGYAADLEKYNAAVLAGWRVLRVTTAMAQDGSVVELLRRALA